MNTEEIFSRRDKDKQTLLVTRAESLRLKMDSRRYEVEFRGDDFYFRGFRVVEKK